jgi:glycosyltransferase involved in cell wall biosynthesis
LKTLLSHEWLAPVGGSENVFESLIAMFPGADVACLWNDAPERFGTNLRESWIARSPLRKSKPLALPFMGSAWRHLDISGYDRVLASSHAFGHQLAARAATVGLESYAYIHTPARYIWAPEQDHRGRGVIARTVSRKLQRSDARTTDSAVTYAANSQYVSDRIRNCWGQDAEVIYPPVDVERIQGIADWRDQLGPEDSAMADSLPDTFVLGASRFVEYKRVDEAIRVGESLQLPVVLCGSGPDEERLRSLASESPVPVHFLGRVSDEFLYFLYQRAALFVFMAVEDFGIMPVEAMAAGTPVLVGRKGGAAESVDLLGGGAVATDNSLPTLIEAAQVAMAADNTSAAVDSALFSKAAFETRIRKWMSDE